MISEDYLSQSAVKCRTRSEEKLALARYEFAQPPLLTNAEIKEILGKLDDPSRWTDEIKSYAQDAVLNHGKQRHGYKVVEGCSVRTPDLETQMMHMVVSSLVFLSGL